ncbi:MAG: carbon storage regulator [Planctomycetia bacterium]
MLVLTRKNRESVVIGRPEDLEIMLEITILEIEGGRVRLGFQADSKMPIHRREVWDRICNGNGHAATATLPARVVDGMVERSRVPSRAPSARDIG